MSQSPTPVPELPVTGLNVDEPIAQPGAMIGFAS
jgi:hypothetical protein